MHFLENKWMIVIEYNNQLYFLFRTNLASEMPDKSKWYIYYELYDALMTWRFTIAMKQLLLLICNVGHNGLINPEMVYKGWDGVNINSMYKAASL